MSVAEQTASSLPTATGIERQPLTSAEKYEKLAFTFCKMGTTGLIAWVLTPPIFVLLVAVIAVALYGKAVTLGLLRSKCILRKPMLIIGFWAVVGIADAVWLFALR
jgi:hypothetical protein